MKFTVTEEKHPVYDAYRIMALEASDYQGISSGDLGGFVSKAENLDSESEAWIFDDSVVLGDSLVTGKTKISENAILQDVKVGMESFISGVSISNATFGNQIRAYGDSVSITLADSALSFKAITANKYKEDSNVAYIGYARFAGPLEKAREYIKSGEINDDIELLSMYLTIMENHLF